MKRILLRRFIFCGLFVTSLALAATTVNGQAKIEFDDGRWVSVGGGLRAAFRAAEQPDGSYTNNVDLDNSRFYFNALAHESFLVELNTEYVQSTSEIKVLDAVAKFGPSEYFNVWIGRHLPPSDRSNLDGPFYLSAYDYPGLVSRYPAIFAGRDDGMSLSGQVDGGVFKYAFGVYKGVPALSGQDDSSLYAARLTYNFLDPEPGYYTSSSYYGSKDVLAVAFVIQFQKEAYTNPSLLVPTGTFEDFRGYSFDFLFEKKLPNDGVISLEGAYYDYDLGAADGGGNSYLAQAGYLIPPKVGPGQFQPQVRFQEFQGDSVLDAGVNYVIRGHSARLSLMFSRTDFQADGGTRNRLILGTQFQF